MLKRYSLTILSTIAICSVFAWGASSGQITKAITVMHGCLGDCAKKYREAVAECDKLPSDQQAKCKEEAKNSLSECNSACAKPPG
jgi:hypothetical protein